MPCVYKGGISDGHFASVCDQVCNNQLCEHKNCWFLSTLLYHNLLTVNSNATKSFLEIMGSILQFTETRYSVSCQFLDIGSHNQLSNEQKRSVSKQKQSVSKQTHLFARNVP